MARFLSRLGLAHFLMHCLLIAGCSIVAPATPSKPTVVINSPPSNRQYQGDETVVVQSTSTDPSGITRVELLVDGTVVHTDSPPSPQQSFTTIQTWKATPGTHTLAVRAFNSSGVMSEQSAVLVAVVPPSPVAAPTPNPTAAAPPVAAATPVPTVVSTPTCVDGADFAADVTVPDGTLLARGQAFNKVWRVRNTGTCAWGPGYELVFVSGQLLDAPRTIGLPDTPAGATADLLVPMTAPTAAGSHRGNWRLRNANGATFGDTMWVIVRIAPLPIATLPAPIPAPAPTLAPVPPPAGCAGAPIINGFSASPSSIAGRQSTTLTWGFVANADRAEIDQGIGGVATPGQINVGPTATTTYTLTATCGASITTAQVTVTVDSPVTPSACSGAPILGGFAASPSTIVSGQSSTLFWGLVSNADRAEIDNGIGGVGTPGQVTVRPTSTTTYTLTGRCGGNTSLSRITVTVVPP